MDVKILIQNTINDTLNLIDPDILYDIRLTKPSKDYGDLSTNAALMYAKKLNMSVDSLANTIIQALQSLTIFDSITFVNGFINFKFNHNIIYDQFKNVFQNKNFGDLPNNHQKVLVEYVSGNPTGLLHIGHARGAIYGSSLIKLLSIAGYTVHSEYYVNDRGKQIERLALSVYLRYLQQNGIKTDYPDDCYQNDMIIEFAKYLYKVHKDEFLKYSKQDALIVFGEKAKHYFLNEIKKDLASLGIQIDNYFYESSLYPIKIIDTQYKLKNTNSTYENKKALYLQSTKGNDDKDRVLIRSNNEPTYLMSDIAYHSDKFKRNYNRYINIWGGDHQGYIARLKYALDILGYDISKLDIQFLQMVSLKDGNNRIKISKRNKSYNLRDLVNVIGSDVTRYFFLMRSINSQLEFDVDLAIEKSDQNPVYYCQYAYARICSVIKKSKINIDELSNISFKELTNAIEIELMNKILDFPNIIKRAADELAVNLIVNYTHELASLFHKYYHHITILTDNIQLQIERLALLVMIQRVLKKLFNIIGIQALEVM